MVFWLNARGSEQSAKLTVAIVGGGFTGGRLAVQLLGQSAGTIQVVLIELVGSLDGA